MQRKYSEPNAYIDNLPKGRVQQDELYDDVDLPDLPVVRQMPCCRELWGDRGKHLAMGSFQQLKVRVLPAVKWIPSPW